jgi:hypothetical protein
MEYNLGGLPVGLGAASKYSGKSGKSIREAEMVRG